MKEYIMALDQGTTSSRCILFDHAGKIVTMAQKEFTQIYPQPGWVEQNPREIWSSQMSVAIEAMANIGASSKNIRAIGITNQRETTIVWDKKTGEPVYNAIVWQCRRTAEQIDELKEKGYGPMLQKRTGLVPDAYFSASKIAWILDHVKGAREAAEKGELLFGTVDTWLIWNLTKGAVHVTDYTNAARTMLFDIHRCCWEEEILELFRIPKEMLPEVRPSSGFFGETQEQIFGGKIPVMGVAGDQQAALFGQCCFEKGDVKNTYGTGCFLLMHTGKEPIISRHGLLTTIAAGTAGEVEYALEGSVFVAGAAIQWLRDEMRIIDSSPDSEYMAKKVKGRDAYDPYRRTVRGICQESPGFQWCLYCSCICRHGGTVLESVCARNDCRADTGMPKGTFYPCDIRVHCLSGERCHSRHGRGCRRDAERSACGRRSQCK